MSSLVKSGLMRILLENPVIMLVVGIIGIVLLVFGVVVLSTLHLLTGLIIGIVLAVVLYVVVRTGIIPMDKYPFIGIIFALIPFLGFIIGVAMDYSKIFALVPLMQTAGTTAYYATATQVQTDVGGILLIVIAIAIFGMFAVKGKGY